VSRARRLLRSWACAAWLASAAAAAAPPADAVAAREYARVEAAATAALTQAGAAGFAWLHTRELLAQAHAEADAGRYQQALELATTARTQAELALVQARAEATAWQARVPR
jgi:hypothetical protein